MARRGSCQLKGRVCVAVVAVVILVVEADRRLNKAVSANDRAECRERTHLCEDLELVAMLVPHLLGHGKAIDKHALPTSHLVSQHVQELEPRWVLEVEEVHVQAQVEVRVGNVA